MNVLDTKSFYNQNVLTVDNISGIMLNVPIIDENHKFLLSAKSIREKLNNVISITISDC